MLFQGHRARSAALRAVARSTQPELPGRPVRQCRQIPWRGSRCAWQEHPSGLLLRRADRHRRIAAVPEPGLRRSRCKAMGPAALLQRPQLLLVKGPGPALPRRHVLRLLPCQRQPGEAAGQSRGPAMGKFELDRRRPIFLGRPHSCLERRSVEFPVPGLAHRAAGVVGHFAGVERQHQQPADDERGLQSVAAAPDGEAPGAGNPRPGQSREQAIQRLCHSRPADPVLSAAEYGMDPACAEGRLRFGRRAWRIEPGLSEYRPVQRGMVAPLQPGARRQADHSDPDHDGARELVLLAGDRGDDPGYGAIPVESVLSAQA